MLATQMAAFALRIRSWPWIDMARILARSLSLRSAVWISAVCLAGILGPHDSLAQPNPTTALLDQYEAGQHASVARQLMGVTDVAAFKKDLERFAPAWTQAAGAAQVRRRRLVAATVALEAATMHFWPEEVDPLIEWGCQLLRKDAEPDEPEHLWQLAAVAVFGRARDDGKLVIQAGPGAPLGSLKRPAPRAVDHIAHALQRFPNEPRFRLAQAMLAAVSADSEPSRDVEWLPTEQLPKNADEAVRRARAMRAIQLFDPLRAVPELGAEAEVRMGYLYLTLHEPKTAITHFAAARDSRDAFVAYLSRFLEGRASGMLGQHADADALYRLALTVIPHALSASEALAADAFLTGKADEAYAITADALSARPRPDDPWNEFGYGDLRLIPDLMTRLREALR